MKSGSGRLILIFLLWVFGPSGILPADCPKAMPAEECRLFKYEQKLAAEAARLKAQKRDLFKKLPERKPESGRKRKDGQPDSAFEPATPARPSVPIGLQVGYLHHFIVGDGADSDTANYFEIGFLKKNSVFFIPALNIIRDEFHQTNNVDGGGASIGYEFSTGLFMGIMLGATGGEEMFQAIRFGYHGERFNLSMFFGFYDEDSPAEFFGLGVGVTI